MGIKSSNLGYPRIGELREWKKELEKFWAGKIYGRRIIKRNKNIALTRAKETTRKRH